MPEEQLSGTTRRERAVLGLDMVMERPIRGNSPSNMDLLITLRAVAHALRALLLEGGEEK